MFPCNCTHNKGGENMNTTKNFLKCFGLSADFRIGTPESFSAGYLAILPYWGEEKSFSRNELIEEYISSKSRADFYQLASKHKWSAVESGYDEYGRQFMIYYIGINSDGVNAYKFFVDHERLVAKPIFKIF